jgi:hypothetical protein
MDGLVHGLAQLVLRDQAVTLTQVAKNRLAAAINWENLC